MFRIAITLSVGCRVCGWLALKSSLIYGLQAKLACVVGAMLKTHISVINRGREDGLLHYSPPNILPAQKLTYQGKTYIHCSSNSRLNYDGICLSTEDTSGGSGVWWESRELA